jgi:hypothetical protein
MLHRAVQTRDQTRERLPKVKRRPAANGNHPVGAMAARDCKGSVQVGQRRLTRTWQRQDAGSKCRDQPRCPGRVRAVHKHSTRAIGPNQRGSLGGFTSAKEDATGGSDPERGHTDMVAAMALPQRAYFASRVTASICGVNRRSSAQDLANSSGPPMTPACIAAR